jgi:16S rRNA (adenine1518-N6/adenine1519-N6)-dimethyltransferase
VIQPRKRLGQNFLRDPNTARKIVAAVGAPPDEPVVEIGPGTGALTGLLAERYERLVAIEIDPRAVALLRGEHPGLDVREMDVLHVDWPALAGELGGPVHVVGNLPYYITTPIVFSLLDAGASVAQALVMIQLEVARRIVAVPRTKEYGILSVVLQRLCRPELLFEVSRNVFRPRPDVASAVVRLDFRAGHRDDVDPAWFRTVVRTAFNQRRKTLRNSLSSITADVPEQWAGARAEELAPHEFVALARYLARPESGAPPPTH